jgi:hypothetical protein
MRRLWPAFLCVLLALALAATAQASQLIDRNATGVKLAVNRKGQAMLTYRAAGRLRHVLVFGAINARQPSESAPQVAFKVDYAGGWGTYRKNLWQHFPNACRAYDGPALPYLVKACKAPDGSYWALQSWQRLFPNLGFTPWLPHQSAYELHMSHWTGEVAKIDAWPDWVLGRKVHHVFGKLTYQGNPVYGFKTNQYGARLDKYGRLIYLDTLDSAAYGQGWRRENSFVTHNPTGMFCYGFYQYDPSRGGYEKPASWPVGELRGPGNGKEYRLTAEGPGVTPDVSMTIQGLHDYSATNPADVSYEQQMNSILDSIVGVDKLCRQH